MKGERLDHTYEPTHEQAFIDVKTLERFTKAAKARVNLTTMDLPREMGFDPKLVSVQHIIDIAERKGLTQKMYEALAVSTPQEMMTKLAVLPDIGPVRETLGGFAHRIGITYDDMTQRGSHETSFLKMVNTPEGVEKLKAALTKLGY